MTRRHFFFGSFALAAGCSQRTQNVPLRRHNVSIIRASSYSVDLEISIRKILIEHNVPIRGKRVVLKPNLVEFSPAAPINTNPVFVAATASAFEALGAASIQIAEGPGHRRTTLDMAEAAGYFESVSKFEDRFTDLNLDEITKIRLRTPFSSLKELYLPHTVLGCDLLVSLPKMKTHHWAGATLAMKNLFGVVPGGVYGWPKNVLHWAGINECVADLHNLFPRQFCLVDGIEAMEGNGPILGSAKMAGVIIAGAHPPSVDATCCHIMQIDPTKVNYLNLVGQPAVQQIGEMIASVQTEFKLLPELERFRLKV
jgi:uncharacterized protein (DUF362 family)